MAAFDPIADSSFQLKIEAETISITSNQGVPNPGNTTINWNLPIPALGCENDGVYSGMVVLLHTKPLIAEHIPQNGTVYVADPTADINLHVGDNINGALVVGAFYECDKKGNNLPLTTQFVISNLEPNVGYYIAGYATDCQNRYHSDGVRTYSDEYGSEDGIHVPATQHIDIKTDAGTCIIPSDGTGLLPNVNYQFDIVVDNTYPLGTNFKVVELNIDGTDAGTYADLVDQINFGILLVDNPPQSPVLPNTGQYYWNATDQQLSSFDGLNHNNIPVIIEPNDPSVVVTGTYWYDPTTLILSQWDTPTPLTWNGINYVSSLYDPVDPNCDSYWIDGVIGRKWNGTVWCDIVTIVKTTDPDDCNIQPCGSWWYDEIELQLNEWNITLNSWEHREAVYWDVAPNALVNGTYWYDSTNETINVLVGGIWDDITNDPNVFIQVVEPIVTVTGVLWYSPNTKVLQIYDGSTSTWTPVPLLTFATDPQLVESCDAWWRSTDNELLIWDMVGTAWVPVVNFTVSNSDPVFPSTLELNQIWFNPATSEVFIWGGSIWEPITEFIVSITDPHNQLLGDGWFNPTTNTWYIRDVPLVGWNEIDPLDVIGDPNSIATGVFWFNPSNMILQIRNGLVWTNVLYNSSPLTPRRGYQWFNTTTNQLLEWNGTEYFEPEPIAVASFYECGIVITSIQTGSSTFTMIPVMTNPGCTASGFADFTVDGASPSTTCGFLGSGGLTREYPVRQLTEQAYLWEAINDGAIVAVPAIGTDGVSGTLSYDTLGVGDDGTPDERRELAYSIRAQLGYPVVEVELTQYQLDTAIQGAIESFRKRSSMAYRRGFYFLDIQPQQQNYLLTNKQIGYNKIVTVTAAYRFTSAFLSTAHGGGVYGQIVLQHLYNMGTYDLTSYHLVSQYVETMQDLFATRLVYNWNETTRELGFFQSFTSPERVLLDCQIERTEQDLFTDRFAKTWIERYALSESMIILARIRGKYGSLPGAGGGVSLDAADLMATAETYRQDLMAQLDDYVVQDMEGVGMNSAFIFGG